MDMVHIKEYVLVGSRLFNELRLISVYDLEIIRIYKFIDNNGNEYKGGFIDAVVIGENNLEWDIIFAEHIIIACCDGNLRQLNISQDLQSYEKLGKYGKIKKETIHFPKIVTLPDYKEKVVDINEEIFGLKAFYHHSKPKKLD